ncbi:hypothetical protein ACP70R_028521 [Stipagrostis hirtigluma subsp. patula]
MLVAGGGDMGPSSAVLLLHLRRLDRFLKRQGLHRAARTLERESLAHFDAAHLQKLVREGRWSAASRYLDRFSPLWEPEGKGTNQQYTALMHSLGEHSLLAFLARRGEEGDPFFPRHSHVSFPSGDAFRTKFPEVFQRHELYRSMSSAEARASVNWDNIKLTTLEKIQELLHLRPDLECRLRMRSPQHMPTPSEIIPLSLGSRVSPRHPRKRIDRKSAREVAHFLLNKRQEITKSPSGFSSNGTSDSMTSDMQIEPAALRADPGLDTTTSVAAGTLGGDGSEAEHARNSLKRKMDAMADTDADASTRLLKARNESSSPL